LFGVKNNTFNNFFLNDVKKVIADKFENQYVDEFEQHKINLLNKLVKYISYLTIISGLLVFIFESPSKALIPIFIIPVLLLASCFTFFGKNKLAFIYFVFSQFIILTIIIFLVHPNFGLNYYYLLVPIMVFIFFEDMPILRTVIIAFSVILFLCSQYVYLNYKPLITTENIALIQFINFISFFIIGCFLVRFYLKEIKIYRKKIDLIFDELKAKNNSLQNFNKVAAHDLNEPLNSVIGFASLIEARLSKRDDNKDLEVEALLNIKDASYRMKHLLNDLMAYSSSEYSTKKVEKIYLNEVLCDVQKNLYAAIEKAKAKVIVDDMPVIYSNYNFMIQLFQNLIANAIKFQSKNLNAPSVKITSKSNRNEVFLYVIDNGIGIPKDKLKTIFEPYKRLNSKSLYKGSGLGLATCVNIVKQFGGKIWVKSELGVGTTFILSFPNKL